MEFTSRLSLVDLDINLVLMQYGHQDEPYLENLKDLLDLEFPEDKITMDELVEWSSMMFEQEELERSFDYCYMEGMYEGIED